MGNAENLTIYRFGGWDFGATPDGDLIMTVIYLDPKSEPKSQEEMDMAVRRISFVMPDGATQALGEAATRVASMPKPSRQ
jgi:hypothetical protein